MAEVTNLFRAGSSRPRATLSFPIIERIQLHRVSLYDSQPNIDLKLGEGVFCLAGANGIGKSTLLAAVNYALSGVVADPGRKFESVEEFYKLNLQYSNSFFDGRISELDRDSASITMTFMVKDHRYTITRPFFRPQDLTFLSVCANDGQIVIEASVGEIGPGELHRSYVNRFLQDSGFSSFEQFVFLQQFILSFDERRFLLFYNQRVLEQALHIAFGKNLHDASVVDNLKREAEKADSNARNAKYQATELSKKIRELQEALGEKEILGDVSVILAEYDRLYSEKDQLEETVTEQESRIKDLSVKLVGLSSKQTHLESAYRKDFADHLRGQANMASNPIIRQSITHQTCALCGASGTSVVESIQARITQVPCPLCLTDIPTQHEDAQARKRLSDLDEQLAKVKSETEECIAGLERVGEETKVSQKQLSDALAKISAFETAHSAVVRSAFRKETGQASSDLLGGFRSSMQQFEQDAIQHRQRRDDLLKQVATYQRVLEEEYASVETDFVPLFKELATQFLGIELTVALERTRQEGLTLALAVDGKTRRAPHQLSESQKFFVDIALRMSLAQFMAHGSKATLYVDTPEGSLDITYESRAGDMFALFVKQGFRLMMTANINSSQLLLQLAAKCGTNLMKIESMTSWRELSEVQKSAEYLFDEALKAIDTAMLERHV